MVVGLLFSFVGGYLLNVFAILCCQVLPVFLSIPMGF